MKIKAKFRLGRKLRFFFIKYLWKIQYFVRSDFLLFIFHLYNNWIYIKKTHIWHKNKIYCLYLFLCDYFFKYIISNNSFGTHFFERTTKFSSLTNTNRVGDSLSFTIWLSTEVICTSDINTDKVVQEKFERDAFVAFSASMRYF